MSDHDRYVLCCLTRVGSTDPLVIGHGSETAYCSNCRWTAPAVRLDYPPDEYDEPGPEPMYRGLLDDHPVKIAIDGMIDAEAECERLRNGILGIALDAPHMEPDDIARDLWLLLEGEDNE